MELESVGKKNRYAMVNSEFSRQHIVEVKKKTTKTVLSFSVLTIFLGLARKNWLSVSQSFIKNDR